MRFYRRMLKTSQIEHVRKEEVLRKIQGTRNLTTRKEHFKFLGHMKKEDQENLTLTGHFEGNVVL